MQLLDQESIKFEFNKWFDDDFEMDEQESSITIYGNEYYSGKGSDKGNQIKNKKIIGKKIRFNFSQHTGKLINIECCN